MTEELMWRKITYPGVKKDYYMISEDGQIMEIMTLKMIPSYDHQGYRRVALHTEPKVRKMKKFLVHRLVAHEFVPNPNNYPVVDHIDGVKDHTHYTNLEWVTSKENTTRARKNGLINDYGFNHSSSIFSEELGRIICEKLEINWSTKEIFRWLERNPNAKMYDNYPLYQFIMRLKHREGWDNITRDYDYSSKDEKRTGRWDKPPAGTGNYKYTEDQIRMVCKYLEDGKNVQDILEIMTGSRKQKDNRQIYDFIDGIRRKKTWTEISCEYNIDNNSTPTRNNTWTPEIAEMIDNEMTDQEIFKIIRSSDTDFNRNKRMKIKRMIDRYKAFKQISTGENIHVHEDYNKE